MLHHSREYEFVDNVFSQKCVDISKQECPSVPEQICVEIPKQNCVVIQKKVPIRTSKQVPKKICDHGDDTQYSEEVTESTRNVSLASILGLININERRAVDTTIETTTENIDTDSRLDQDTGDQLIFF